MALHDQHELQAINQIAESLDSGERRVIFYLCECLDTDNSVTCMKDMLKHKVTRHDTSHLLLTELMWQLRRYDILRKVFQTSREEVARTLKYRRVLSGFRVLMANISEDMVSEDVNRVKFLLSSKLAREKTEKAKSFLDLIIELEKLDVVSPERVDFVEECLRNIDRIDLAKKVRAYNMQVGKSEKQSPQQQRGRPSHPFSGPNGSYPLQQARQALPRHSAESVPMPIYREQSRQSQLDLYKFNTNPRGVCVIIDCVGNDGDMLEQTFKALHFNVILHKWLSVDETLSALRGIFRQREILEGADGFVCCLISRGTESHLLGTDLYTTGLGLDNVRRLFTAEACPMLAGKPKLFFIQRYSIPEYQPCARMDHRDEDLETDGCDGLARCHFIPTDADVFWSHCWTDEKQLEQRDHSSIYLKALTDALHKGQMRHTNLVDVHIEVNGAIFEHNKRNPGAKYHIDLKHTLRKDLYLQ